MTACSPRIASVFSDTLRRITQNPTKAYLGVSELYAAGMRNNSSPPKHYHDFCNLVLRSIRSHPLSLHDTLALINSSELLKPVASRFAAPLLLHLLHNLPDVALVDGIRAIGIVAGFLQNRRILTEVAVRYLQQKLPQAADTEIVDTCTIMASGNFPTDPEISSLLMARLSQMEIGNLLQLNMQIEALKLGKSRRDKLCDEISDLVRERSLEYLADHSEVGVEISAHLAFALRRDHRVAELIVRRLHGNSEISSITISAQHAVYCAFLGRSPDLVHPLEARLIGNLNKLGGARLTILLDAMTTGSPKFPTSLAAVQAAI